MADEPTAAPVREKEWYADGLHFACTSCGNCCTGPPGAVWFKEDEGRRMAEKLGISVKEFRRRFARKLNGNWSLNERDTEHGFDCIFLDRGSVPGKAVCSVYEARPTQCRTWPFWAENLTTQRAWLTAKHATPCPGMDDGPLVPVEQIRILRDTISK